MNKQEILLASKTLKTKSSSISSALKSQNRILSQISKIQESQLRDSQGNVKVQMKKTIKAMKNLKRQKTRIIFGCFILILILITLLIFC